MAHGKAREFPGELRLGDRDGSILVVSPPDSEFMITIEEHVVSLGGRTAPSASWAPSDRSTALAAVAGMLRRLGAREVSTAGRPSDLDEALTLVLATIEDQRKSADDAKVAAFRLVMVSRGQARSNIVRDTPPPSWDSLDPGQRDEWRAKYADTVEAMHAARLAGDADRGRMG